MTMIPKFSIILVSFVVICIVGSTFATLCPGQKIRCRNDQTCCSDKRGSYGCCPYGNATCCSDGTHCCPQNTVCDTVHSRCRMQSELTLLVPATEIDSNEQTNDITNFLTMINGKKSCPDGKSACPENYTCCEEYTGGYACCPLKNAVCCKDKIHCSAAGTSC